MKRILVSVLVIASLSVVVAAILLLFRGEQLLTDFQRLVVSMLGTAAVFVANGVMGYAKGDVFGKWTFQVVLDGILVPNESEGVIAEDGEKLIKYDWPWWIVYYGFGQPSFSADRAAEGLIREYCQSMGFIMGNTTDVRVNKQKRTITVNLTSEKILFLAELKRLVGRLG